jgi:hypothetical protein
MTVLLPGQPTQSAKPNEWPVSCTAIRRKKDVPTTWDVSMTI